MLARDNPFCTDRVLRVRYKLSGQSWANLMSRLARLNYRAAIIGPPGSGKTTLLEDLEPRLVERGLCPRRLRLDEERNSFPPEFLRAFIAELNLEDVVLFDGAEQMGWMAWRRFERATRKAGGLIISTHSAGRLQTLIECRTTPALLEEILDEILSNKGSIVRDEVGDLFHKHRGNLREVLREFYDRCAASS